MSKMLMDMSDLYARTREAARVAIAGAPDSEYSMADIMPDHMWATVLSSQYCSTIPLHATLNGCIDALRGRGIGSRDVERARSVSTQGSAITDDDLRVARSWLADILLVNIDEEGQQQIVDRETLDRGWLGDAVRISSLMLALILISGGATNDGEADDGAWWGP